MLSVSLKNSIAGFRVSNNCDSTSTDSFINSYIERKDKIISNKVKMYRVSPQKVNKKKLIWEIYILKEFKENIVEVRNFIDILLTEDKKDSEYIDDYLKSMAP